MNQEDVEKLIGQDPMGLLDKPFDVTINGQTFKCCAESYVASNGLAKVAIRSLGAIVPAEHKVA